MFGVDDLLVGGLMLASTGGSALAQEEEKRKQARLASRNAFSAGPRVASSSPSQPQASTMPAPQAPSVAQPRSPMGSGPYDAYQPPSPVMTGSGGMYRAPSEGPPPVQPTPREGYEATGYRDTEEKTPEMAQQEAEARSASQGDAVPLYLRGAVGAGILGGAAALAMRGKGEVMRGESPGGMRELPGGGRPESFVAQHRALQNYLEYYRSGGRGGGGMGYGI